MAYADVVSVDSPFAYWRFEETTGSTLADEGTAYDATLSSGTLNVSGIVGSGLQYASASSNYSTHTTLGSFGSSLNSSTVEFWIKTTTTSQQAVCGVFNTGTTVGWQIQLNASKSEALSAGSTYFFYRNNSGGTTQFAITQNIYDGEWHHIVVTKSTSTHRVYVDSAEVPIDYNVNNSGGAAFANFGYALAFGARNVRGTVGMYADATIDEVALYASVLSRERIDAHYVASDRTPRRAWSWWTRPRAVEKDYRLFVGGMAASGSSVVDEYDRTGLLQVHYLRDFSNNDHANPAIVLAGNKPPIVIYSNHNVDNFLRYRVGTRNIESGMVLGSESTINSGDTVTYPVAHLNGGDVFVFFRSPSSAWRYVKSTDWASTWSTPADVFTLSDQFYMASVNVDGVVRAAMSGHPTLSTSQSIYYAEINLATNAITEADGTSLGTLGGSSIAMTSCDLAATPTTGYRTWVFDVSDGPNPEIAWMEWDGANRAATATYKYTYWNGTTWTTEDIVASGDRWSSDEEYFGGVQFPRISPGGVAYTSRLSSGTWYVEEQVTTDNGANWTPTSITSSTDALARVWPMEGDASVYESGVVLNRMYRLSVVSTDPYTQSWDGTLEPFGDLNVLRFAAGRQASRRLLPWQSEQLASDEALMSGRKR